MICLRCGYCCQKYLVIIVDEPNKGLVESNLVTHEGDKDCKHLLGSKPGEYSCALHGYKWYAETPCAEHAQVEYSSDTPCRIGKHILDSLVSVT